MEVVVSVFRIFHILSGFVGFFVAPVALATQKGGTAHRTWGKIYFWAMTSATLASLVISFYRPNWFLFLVGIFSFYLSFSGYRALFLKGKNSKAGILDWSVSLITGIVCLVMIILGTGLIHQAFNPMFLVFGLIGFLISIKNMRKYLNPSKEKSAWFFDHMTGMVASYIAAVTAFSAVNFMFLPTVLRWLWPTIIGAPLLSIWIRSYKKKFNKAS